MVARESVEILIMKNGIDQSREILSAGLFADQEIRVLRFICKGGLLLKKLF
jgi:hypothetical protein